jgi:hypothetical protein
LACTWHQAMITEAMAMADAVNSSSFLNTQFSRQTECTTTMKTVLQKHRIDLWLCCWALRKLWRYALAEQTKGGPTLLQWSMIRASNLPAASTTCLQQRGGGSVRENTRKQQFAGKLQGDRQGENELERKMMRKTCRIDTRFSA